MLNVFKNYVTTKNIIFFVIAILFLIFITKIKDIAILFFASFVIACSLNPLVDKLMAKFKKLSRSLASSLVLGTVLTISASFLIPIISMAGTQIKSFIKSLPEYFQIIKEFILQIPYINKSTIAELDMGGLISSATGFTTKFVNGSINFSMEFASAIVYF